MAGAIKSKAIAKGKPKKSTKVIAKGKKIGKAGKAAKKPVKKRLLKEPEWTKEELAVLNSLTTPEKIQNFLDGLKYDPSDFYPSVRRTLRTRTTHCVGGGLLAALCLERNGYGRAQLLELRTVRDDDHVIAVYQRNGHWGSISKSNFTGMRGRDPVYASLRELAMSYHESCFNSLGEKTLRGFSSPLDLATFDKAISHRYGLKSGAWKFTARDMFELDHDKYWLPVTPTVPGLRIDDASFPEFLPKVTSDRLAAGLLGSNPAGLYIPGRN
jgi:hypothetical protein